MDLLKTLKEVVPALKQFAERRRLELKDLGNANFTVAEVELGTGGARVKFTASVERVAAWELYVELNTRIGTQELAEDEGMLREALSSLHAIFGITRQILKNVGPGVGLGQESLASYVLAILNRVLRPFLAKWHPRLTAWEAARPQQQSAVEHERLWDQHAEIRKELGVVRQILAGYSEAVGILAGVNG